MFTTKLTQNDVSKLNHYIEVAQLSLLFDIRPILSDGINNTMHTASYIVYESLLILRLVLYQ
jgi:hypothetical protein